MAFLSEFDPQLSFWEVGGGGFPCQNLQAEAPPLEAKAVEDQPEAGDVCSDSDKCKLGSVRAMMLLRLKKTFAEIMNANLGILF